MNNLEQTALTVFRLIKTYRIDTIAIQALDSFEKYNDYVDKYLPNTGVQHLNEHQFKTVKEALM